MLHAWSPLRHGTFRALWIASVASNIGTWMHTVAASWLMTTLAPSPLLIALVQTATALPVFLVALPAGAVADLVDRRRLLLFTQTWMLAVAAALGALTLMGKIGPWWLLGLTFALGLGSAMNGPGWMATVPELVPRPELATAVALNSVGFNIARAVGPALGGLVMAASNAGVVFILNGISFLGVILVLWRWRPKPAERTEDRASLVGAMRGGMRYVLSAPVYHSVLIRSGMFGFTASALWGLLPVVASVQLHSTSMGYGILLGCLGAGSVIAASLLAPLRTRHSADRVVAVGVVLFAAAMALLAVAKVFAAAAVATLAGGMAWLTVMSTFNVCAQTAPPVALRARALAVYLLVFQGGMAIGSGTWGAVADHFGAGAALLVASVLTMAGLSTIRSLPLPSPMAVAQPDAVSIV